MTVNDVIVIGSGAAGYTAAIYSCRSGRKTLLVGGSLPGGQLMITSDVENFPGFPDGVLGPELMERMRKQAERFGPDIIFDDATAVDFKNRPFKVTVSGKTHSGRAVIVATGAVAKWLGLASETKFRGKGVSSCATCDGYFFKEKDVVVVGGGDIPRECRGSRYCCSPARCVESQWYYAGKSNEESKDRFSLRFCYRRGV